MVEWNGLKQSAAERFAVHAFNALVRTPEDPPAQLMITEAQQGALMRLMQGLPAPFQNSYFRDRQTGKTTLIVAAAIGFASQLEGESNTGVGVRFATDREAGSWLRKVHSLYDREPMFSGLRTFWDHIVFVGGPARYRASHPFRAFIDHRVTEHDDEPHGLIPTASEMANALIEVHGESGSQSLARTLADQLRVSQRHTSQSIADSLPRVAETPAMPAIPNASEMADALHQRVREVLNNEARAASERVESRIAGATPSGERDTFYSRMAASARAAGESMRSLTMAARRMGQQAALRQEQEMLDEVIRLGHQFNRDPAEIRSELTRLAQETPLSFEQAIEHMRTMLSVASQSPQTSLSGLAETLRRGAENGEHNYESIMREPESRPSEALIAGQLFAIAVSDCAEPRPLIGELIMINADETYSYTDDQNISFGTVVSETDGLYTIRFNDIYPGNLRETVQPQDAIHNTIEITRAMARYFPWASGCLIRMAVNSLLFYPTGVQVSAIGTYRNTLVSGNIMINQTAEQFERYSSTMRAQATVGVTDENIPAGTPVEIASSGMVEGRSGFAQVPESELEAFRIEFNSTLPGVVTPSGAWVPAQVHAEIPDEEHTATIFGLEDGVSTPIICDTIDVNIGIGDREYHFDDEECDLEIIIRRKTKDATVAVHGERKVVKTRRRK